MSTDAQRFVVTDAPALAPGVCFVTRTGVGPFIDTGVDMSPPGRIDRGRLYLSAEAIKEMAEQLHLLERPEEYRANLEDAYDTGYNKGYEEAIKEDIGGNISRAVADLSELLGQLTAYMVPSGSETPEDTGPVLTLVEPAGGEEPVADSGADEGSAQPRRTQRKKSGSGGSKRPNRIPADTGDDTDLRI